MKAQLSCHQSLTCWINSHNASLDFCHDETVDIWFIILNKFTIFIWILFYHDVQMSPAATFMTTNSIWMMTISLRPCTKEYPTTHLIYVFTWQNIFLSLTATQTLTFGYIEWIPEIAFTGSYLDIVFGQYVRRSMGRKSATKTAE